MNEEIWKDVVGYEGQYEVSSWGNVRSVDRYVGNHTGFVFLKGREKKKRQDEKGYLRVYLSKNGHNKYIPIHRLVAMAFIPNPENKPQVNHIDCDKTNNHVENLEWCNNSENQIHAYKNGLNYYSEKSGKPKKIVVKINPDTDEILDIYESASEAARQNNLTQGTLSSCCRQEYGRKTLGGYIWRYEEEVMCDGTVQNNKTC